MESYGRTFRRASVASLLAAAMWACIAPGAPAFGATVTVDPEVLISSPQRFWARSILFKDRLAGYAGGRSQRLDGKRYIPFSTRVVGTCYTTEELVPTLNSLDLNRDYAFSGSVFQHRGRYYIVVSAVSSVVDPADMVREMRELAPDLDPAMTGEALKPIADIVWEVESAHLAYAQEREVPLCDLYDPQSIHFPKTMEVVRSAILKKEMQDRTVSSEMLAQYLVLALARSCAVTSSRARAVSQPLEPAEVAPPAPDAPIPYIRPLPGAPPSPEPEVPAVAEEEPEATEEIVLRAAPMEQEYDPAPERPSLLQRWRTSRETRRAALEANRDEEDEEYSFDEEDHAPVPYVAEEPWTQEAEEARVRQQALEAERIAAEQERLQLQAGRERIAAERAEMERRAQEIEAARRAQEARDLEQRGILERRERERIAAARAEQERYARETEAAQQRALEKQQVKERPAAVEEKKKPIEKPDPPPEPQEEAAASWWQRFRENRRIAREEARRRQQVWDELFLREEERIRAERQARREEQERDAQRQQQTEDRAAERQAAEQAAIEKQREEARRARQQERAAAEQVERDEQAERDKKAAPPPVAAPSRQDLPDDIPFDSDADDMEDAVRVPHHVDRQYREYQERMQRDAERVERRRIVIEQNLERQMRRSSP